MSVRTDVVNLNVNINGDKAKDELNQLRKRFSDLSSEMKGLTKNTAEYKAAASELSSVSARMTELRNQIGLTSLSQKELTAKLKELNAIKNIMTPGTQEFKNLQKEIDGVKSRLTEVKTGMTGFKQVFSNIGAEVKGFGILAASYLGFEFVTQGLHNIISGAGKTSDALAQLQIYMHGSAKDAQDLYAQLRLIDTRTSNSQLLDIAGIVAKKGVAKEEIVGVTKALDQLFVVLGTEIGDPHEAVASLVKLVNVYSDDHHVTAKNIADIGSAIQGMTSSGVATGAFLISFAERLAGVRGITGITIQSVLGLGSALEELGQRNESAATAAQKLIIQMFLKPADYAKAAGLAIKDFSALLAKDPVEALIKVAATLKQTGKAPQDLINAFGEMGVNGARVIGVLGDIAGNADYMRKRTEDAYKFFGNAGALTDAFNIKNETLGATLDKIGKKMAAAFTSSSLLAFLKDAAVGFAKLIGAVDDTNKALDEFHKQKKYVDDLNKSILPLIDDYDRLADKAEISATEQKLLQKAIDGIAAAIPSAITQFDAYGKAIGVSTDQAREFLRIQKLVLNEKNRDAIKASDETIHQLETDLLNTRDGLARFESLKEANRAYWDTSMYPGEKWDAASLEKMNSQLKYWTDGVTQAEVKIGQLQARIAGQKGIKAELTGDPLLPGDNSAPVSHHADTNTNGITQKEIVTLGKLRIALQAAKDAREDINKEDKKALATNQALIDSLDSQVKHLEGKKTASDKANERAENKLETIAQKLKRFQQDAARLKSDLDAAEAGKDEKDIQVIKDKYDKLLEQIDRELHDKKGNLLTDAASYAALVAGLNSSEVAELNDLVQKQFEARSEKEYDASIQNLKDYYNDRRQEVIKAYADELIDKKTYLAKLKALDSDEATDTVTIDKDYSGTSKKAKKATEGDETKAAKDKAAQRDAEVDADNKAELYSAERAVLVATKGSDAELEAKKALLKKKFDLDNEYLDKSSEQYKKNQAQLNNDLKEADKAYFQEKIAQTEQVLQGLSNLFTSYVNLLNDKDTAKLNKEKALNDTRKADQQKLLNKKLISQKQYDETVAQMDANMDKRQQEINDQQAKRTKAAALFSAIINGALGITKIWAQYGDVPYYAAILTAIEAAAVGVQIAAISQQDTPKGRKGLVVQGSSHEQGGIDMIDRGTGKPVANIEGGEPVLVLSKSTYGNNRGLIDTLLYNSQHRNGARVVAPWYGAQPAPVNSARIIPFMRTGGVVNNTNGATAAAGSNNAGTNEISSMMLQLIAEQQMTRDAIIQQRNTPQRSYVVFQDITSQADLLARAKSVAGVKQAA